MSAWIRGPHFTASAMAGEQVVEGDGEVAGLGQRLAGVRADIAGAAGDQDAFHSVSKASNSGYGW